MAPLKLCLHFADDLVLRSWYIEAEIKTQTIIFGWGIGVAVGSHLEKSPNHDNTKASDFGILQIIQIWLQQQNRTGGSPMYCCF